MTVINFFLSGFVDVVAARIFKYITMKSVIYNNTERYKNKN